jgi:hypothetical protein
MSATETIPSPAPVVEPAISTGPRSDDGKATSSRNAVKHNLCSKKLTGADLEELNDIRAKLDNEWEPQTETERLLLAQMALSQWRMDRALSLELAAFDQDSLDPAALALALRYRTTAERSFYKALAELQRVQALICRNAQPDEQVEEEEEDAVQREIERLIMAPFARAPHFVSQNNTALPSQRGSSCYTD